MSHPTTRLNVIRLEKHLAAHYEIKDPSIVKTKDGTYMMYASVGNSTHQQWIVGRFVADDVTGAWREVEPVVFDENLHGPQLCAPAVTYQVVGDQEIWQMYIQTACFEENGSILYAESFDGQSFRGQPQPIVTRDTVNATPETPVVGVYDVGVSEITIGDDELVCMLYSGYRSVGCGDIYLSYKNKKDSSANWTRGERLLAQEEVPFHNRPDYEHYEWGLEGAKLIQLTPETFLMIGVCFMPKPNEYLGTRQRVFMAVSDSLNGPYKPIGFPFVPSQEENHRGENGHPDTLVEGNELHVIYQERGGNNQPWYLRHASFDIPLLQTFLQGTLTADQQLITESPSEVQDPESFHFLYH